MKYTSIDIFCHVVDNFGDIGVVYRFAREFQRNSPEVTIRVFVDDLGAFAQINQQIDKSRNTQTIDSITYLNTNSLTADSFRNSGIGDVLIEAFACEIPEFIMERAYFESKLLINLEYLSAEEWVEGYHLKESLLPKGTLKKFFYMPGFTKTTGGIILNSSVPHEQKTPFEYLTPLITNVLAPTTIRFNPEERSVFGTIFTYLRDFSSLLQTLIKNEWQQFYLLVFGTKSREGILHTLQSRHFEYIGNNYIHFENIHLIFMPYLPQLQYDTLLYHTDFNIVRGEDSLVRAVLAGKPFIWNAYIQESKYQKVKVEALCKNMLQYFDSNDDFSNYFELMMQFNDIEKEEPKIVSEEQYEYFFKNLHKLKHATSKMSYFVQNNCNLIEKISSFITNY
jgi:uncharacterized repeat protein (TIGR03837 family)